MNKTVTTAIGFALSALLAAAVHAGPNDSSGTAQDVRSAQSVTNVQQTPKKNGLSKRNKAVMQQSEEARKRKELIRSSGTNTMQKKMSKRNKAMMQQSEEAKKRKSLIKSSETGTMPK
jgi:hypothetical protein